GHGTANRQVAKLTPNGITTEAQAVTTLNKRFVDDGHYHVDPKQTSRHTRPERGRIQEQFAAHNDIESLAPNKNVRRLPEDIGGSMRCISASCWSRAASRRGITSRPKQSRRAVW